MHQPPVLSNLPHFRMALFLRQRQRRRPGAGFVHLLSKLFGQRLGQRKLRLRPLTNSLLLPLATVKGKRRRRSLSKKSRGRRRKNRRCYEGWNPKFRSVEGVENPSPPLHPCLRRNTLQMQPTRYEWRGSQASSRLPCVKGLCHHRPFISHRKRCLRRNLDQRFPPPPRRIAMLSRHQPANVLGGRAYSLFKSAPPHLWGPGATPVVMATLPLASINSRHHVTGQPNLLR